MKVTVVTLPVVLAAMASSVAAISPKLTLHLSDGSSSVQYRSDASCLNVNTVSSTPTVAVQINDFNFYCFTYDGLNCTGDQFKLGNTNWYNLSDMTGLSNITSLWCYQQFFC
ncbi:unnamed protein product [Peniophora sp. CBMAI 1063]|nr:unnamed protein product [Peniophora sp. CBMAI 1063]